PASHVYPLSLHDALPISGLISTQAATELITSSLDENMTVDLSAHGETSIGTWVDMFKSGEIQIAEFVSGLEQFLGEGTRFDLSEDRKSTRLNSSHVSISY